MRAIPLFFALAACATSASNNGKSDPVVNAPEEKPAMSDRTTDGTTREAGVETPGDSLIPATFTAAQFTEWCDAALAHAGTLRAALETGNATTSALLDYNELMRVLDMPNGWAALLFQVSPDADVRAAADGCKQRLAKFGNDVVMSRPIFESLAKQDHAAATDEARRAHRLILREFKRSGVDQDETERNRLKDIFERMVLLGQEYQKNASADVRFVEIDSEARLAGMPEDWIAPRRPKAGEKLRISTDYPDYIPLLTYCKDGDLRKQLAIAFAARGYPQNEAIMAEVLKLRREYATLLGYASWATYNAEDKMVKTTDVIEKFLVELEGIVRPRSAADTAELLARKQKDDPKTDGFAVWDRFYYLNVVREEKYGYDSQETRQYFPYASVKNGVLDTYAELFGLSFERATDIPTWHADVEAYRLRKPASGQQGDKEGELLGVFYLDMHPREDKYKHAAMFPIQTGLATGRLPIASLVCNFPNPTTGDALMEHQDVETFFHEFGHLLHQLLASRASFVNLGGIAVEWDFVEAPSQILEEWAWSHEVLARFAKHVKTGEVIPASLVEKMGRSDEFGKGAETMRQLFFAAYSYFLHERDPAKVDLEAFSDEIFAKFSPYARVPGDRIYCNFGHLIGYSSAYYTYQWSLMIAKDLFGRFAKAGIMDRATAQAYADTILAPGGLKDSVDLVQDFLGRPYSLDAYRAWLSE